MKINKRRLLLVLFALLTSMLSVLVMAKVFRDNIIFFYSVSEYVERHGEILSKGRPVKVGGIVHSISRVAGFSDTITFTMADHKNQIKARYRGMIPALFREGQGAVITGLQGADGIFQAKQILAKHDERYIPRTLHDEMVKSSLPDT